MAAALPSYILSPALTFHLSATLRSQRALVDRYVNGIDQLLLQLHKRRVAQNAWVFEKRPQHARLLGVDLRHPRIALIANVNLVLFRFHVFPADPKGFGSHGVVPLDVDANTPSLFGSSPTAAKSRASGR